MLDVYKIKLHTEYQRPHPSSFIQKDFLSFAYRILCKTVDLFRKNAKVNPKVITCIFKLYWVHVPNAAYQAPVPLALWFRRRRFFFLWVYHKRSRRTSWSCDPHAANKCSVPWPMEALRLHMKFGFDWLCGF